MKIDVVKIKIDGVCYLREVDNNKLDKISDGEILEVSIKINRRYEKLQAYYACCNMIAQNAKKPEYNNLELTSQEKVDYYTRVKTGFVKCIVVTPSETIIQPKSISYDKCSESDFEDYFYGRAVKLWEEFSGISVQDILINWEQYKK